MVYEPPELTHLPRPWIRRRWYITNFHTFSSAKQTQKLVPCVRNQNANVLLIISEENLVIHFEGDFISCNRSSLIGRSGISESGSGYDNGNSGTKRTTGNNPYFLCFKLIAMQHEYSKTTRRCGKLHTICTCLTG